MFDFDIYLTIGIILLLVVIAVKDRKNIEFKQGLIIRRTKRGKKWIYDTGKKYSKFFKVYSTVAVIVCIIASLIGFFLIASLAYNSVVRPKEAQPSVGLFLPQIPGVKYPSPYIMGIPISYWIITVLAILFSHELSHALVGRAEKIRIQSFGILLFLIFPGAFVEPDERQLKKSRMLTRLRLYAAGSFGNFSFAVIILLISTGLFNATAYFLKPDGVMFNVIPNTPASDMNLSGVITSVNSNKISTIIDFVSVMNKVKPGETVEIKTTTGAYNLKTVSNPENGNLSYVGINFVGNNLIYSDGLKQFGQPSQILVSPLEWLFGWPMFSPIQLGLFSWLILLSFFVGLFNILPIKPLDGGLMFESLFSLVSKKKATKLANYLTYVTIILILITVWISLMPK